MGLHFKKNYPFLISIDPFTEEWSVVTYPNKNLKETIPQYQIVQEKLVRDFVTNWFTISTDSDENENRWKQCDASDCSASEQFNPDNITCAIFCKSDESVFKEFSENVLPDYKSIIVPQSGKWGVGGMLITPTKITQTSGTWQAHATIYPTLSAPFNVLTFITIEQDSTKYPATLGYYVKTFNSYRINNE